ncbi:MAG TPA: VOC family protein [Moraxellaceae bacterium]
MESMNPYIDFSGRCREALAFYTKCFGGEIVRQMSYSDAKIDVPEQFRDYLLHAEFKAPGLRLMASDGRPGQAVAPSSRIMLCLHFTDNEEQTQVFDSLGQGGNVIEPLAIAFWGDRFGMVSDPFGVQWMLICPQQK